MYSFDKKTRHCNARTVDSEIAYKDPIMDSTVIIIINQAIKIESMTNILVCPMQCCVHGTKATKCPNFLPVSPAEDNMPFWCMTLVAASHPSPFHSHWIVLPVTLRPDVPALLSMKTRVSQSIQSPLWDPSTSLYSLHEEGMVDYKGCLIAKLSTDPCSPGMVVSSVVSASYLAIDNTDNENFAAVLDHHVKVDMNHDYCSADCPSHHISVEACH